LNTSKNQRFFLLLLFLIGYTLSYCQTDALDLFDQAEDLANDRKYELSNQKYEAVLPLFLQEQNWPKYYATRYAITYNLIDLYQFENAQKEINDAVSHLEQNYRDTFIIWQPKLYHAKGQAHYKLHEYDDAIVNNRLAMKLYQKVPDKIERIKYTGFMYNNIGSAYKQARLMDSALHYFQIALPLKQASIGPNASSTLRTIKSISGIYQDWGQLDKAIQTQTIALNGALEKGNKDAEAQAYNGLSQMYQRKRDFETSKKYISKSLEIYKKMPEYKLDLAHSYHQMGNVLETEKAHKESLEWYGKAHNYMAQQLEASGPEYVASHPKVRALRAIAVKHFEENEDIFAEAVGRDHARWIELWLSKGVCLIENQDTTGAHDLFAKAYNRAYRLAPEKSYDRSLSCLNLARTTKDPDSAMVLYQRGLWELSNDWEPKNNGDNPTAKESFYEDWSVEIMLMKAKRLTDLHGRDGNDQYIKDGISTMIAADGLLQDSRRSYLTTSAKISLGKRGHEIYAKGAELCHTIRGYETQAFDFFEKSKGLVLLEALHLGNNSRSLMVPDSLMSKVRRLDNQIDELIIQQNDYKNNDRLSEVGAIIFDLEKEREALKNKISASYPIANRISGDDIILSLETVQQLLNPNEVLYEYLETKTDLYILKIEKDKSNLFKVAHSSYSEPLDSFLLLINDEDIALNHSNSPKVWNQYRRTAYNLFNHLLPEYNNEKLLIIPDGKLNYLPFELLITDDAPIDQVNYGLLPYLIKSNAIKYAFSSSLHFAQLDIRKENQNTLLAMAPTYPDSPTGLLASRDGFSALKYTVLEATTISNIMNGDALLGSQATVDLFKEKASNYQVLHLAMHAYTHDVDPMLSGMIFTDTEDDTDHILHAYELYNMDIPSQMVVLSACNTGLGQHQKGEGVMSLGRAFRHAGTQNVIMSLWQANDETTSEIMTSFYTHLKEGIPKAEALRNAKLAYLSSGVNVFPHFWGSFVLLGDDQPLEIQSKRSLPIWTLGVMLMLLILVFIWQRNN